MDLRNEAKKLILQNYEATGEKYICPSWPHYKAQWLWDSCFHAIICAELGMANLAKNEIEQLLRWQRKDGWIPHMIYNEKPLSFFSGIERFLFKKREGKFHSSHTQPPIMAQAVEEIQDAEWARKILPHLADFYIYFAEKQDPDQDGIISICHPCESGRDTSPEFDFFGWKTKEDNLSRFSGMIGYHFSILKLEWEYKKLDWNIQKIWQKDLFNVEDLMFHCLWIDGLRSLIRLWIACERNEWTLQQLKRLADRAEEAVYRLCWDEKDKIFYSLDSKNQKIKQLTISNLFPLILDNIPVEMHQALVYEHLVNPNEFWTEYPIPSAAVNGPAFDPGSEYYCNWRGPVWISMNYFIIKGLVKHGYLNIAEEIAQKSWAMLRKEGFWEFYNPLTGKGLRKATRNLGWSALPITFLKILKRENK